MHHCQIGGTFDWNGNRLLSWSARGGKQISGRHKGCHQPEAEEKVESPGAGRLTWLMTDMTPMTPLQVSPHPQLTRCLMCSNRLLEEALWEGTESEWPPPIFTVCLHPGKNWPITVYHHMNWRGEPCDLLVIPWPCTPLLLHLAHKHPLGGHLGPKQMLEKLQDRFTRPGINSEVLAFCMACSRCQWTTTQKPCSGTSHPPPDHQHPIWEDWYGSRYHGLYPIPQGRPTSKSHLSSRFSAVSESQGTFSQTKVDLLCPV